MGRCDQNCDRKAQRLRTDRYYRREDAASCEIDPLDNCRVKLEDAMETLLDLSADEVGKYAISPKVREDAFAGKCICSKDRRTPMDYWVSYVAYFYDLNFQETLDIVAEEQYVKRIIGRVPYTNEQTKKTMEELERQLTEYVRRK